MRESPFSPDAIVVRALDGKTPDSKPFLMVVLAAPRGGKSSMVRLLKAQHPRDDHGRAIANERLINKKHTIIISDRLFEDWPARQRLKGLGVQHAEKSEALVQQYCRAVECIIRAAAARNISIVIEDQGDQPEWLKSVIRSVPNVYEKILIGIGQDKERYFLKAKERVEDQKYVDHRRLLESYRQLSTHWDDYVRLCDYSMLYFRKGQEKPHLAVAFSQQGQKEVVYGEPGKKRYAEFRWQRFLDSSLPPEEAWQNAKAAAGHADNGRGMAESRNGTHTRGGQIEAKLRQAYGR